MSLDACTMKCASDIGDNYDATIKYAHRMTFGPYQQTLVC